MLMKYTFWFYQLPDKGEPMTEENVTVRRAHVGARSAKKAREIFHKTHPNCHICKEEFSVPMYKDQFAGPQASRGER